MFFFAIGQQTHIALVSENELVHNGQPKTRARRSRGVERIEDPIRTILGNQIAIVLNPESNGRSSQQATVPVKDG